MASTLIAIQHTENIRPLRGTRKGDVRNIINALEAYSAGAKRATSIDIHANNSADLVAASGTVTISGGSGSITAIIGGVSISITWATSDTNSAALLAAQINASTNALVQFQVTATSAAGVCTITAVQKGAGGNHITFTATGTGATASGSGRLALGAGGVATAVSHTF